MHNLRDETLAPRFGKPSIIKNASEERRIIVHSLPSNSKTTIRQPGCAIISVAEQNSPHALPGDSP
jgi:hypothetical protein